MMILDIGLLFLGHPVNYHHCDIASAKLMSVPGQTDGPQQM